MPPAFCSWVSPDNRWGDALIDRSLKLYSQNGTQPKKISIEWHFFSSQKSPANSPRITIKSPQIHHKKPHTKYTSFPAPRKKRPQNRGSRHLRASKLFSKIPENLPRIVIRRIGIRVARRRRRIALILLRHLRNPRTQPVQLRLRYRRNIRRLSQMERHDRFGRQRSLARLRSRRDSQSGHATHPSANCSAHAASGDTANHRAKTRQTDRVPNRIRRLAGTLVPPEVRGKRVSLAAKRHIRKL